MNRFNVLVVGVFLTLFLVGCTDTGLKDPALFSEKVTIYKAASCGCCVGYASYLDGKRVNTETVVTENMNSIKQQYGVPANMQSCHTSIVGDYFVEGHVPLEVVQKLLKDQPDIDGIALPRMPAGTPGMPGVQTEPWIIYAIKDGHVISEFTTIGVGN
jgi:hypothetical protein